MLGRLHAAWRATGAELPFGDLGAERGTPFEGWYWRLADPASGRVVVALCGGMRTWALGALAVHPGGFVRECVADGPAAVFTGAVHATVAADAQLQVELRGARPWPRRALGALGPAQLLPRLPQYWQPLVLHARAYGEARAGGERIRIEGWDAYHEKNWGPEFAGDWWWGQAHVAGGAGVAFAGGRIGPGVAPTAIVAHVGEEVVAIAPPGLVRTRLGDGTWAVRARSARHTITVEAEATGPPHILPVPKKGSDPFFRRGAGNPRICRANGEKGSDPFSWRSHQHLAGRLVLEVRRGRRLLLREETALAGLERGVSARRGGRPR